MLNIVNGNVHRIVSESDYERFWKEKGFEVAGDAPQMSDNQYTSPYRESPYQEPLASDQYAAQSPTPAPYTQEQLEQMERKDLFAIADSLGFEYPPNIPSARLIDQILAYQTAR